MNSRKISRTLPVLLILILALLAGCGKTAPAAPAETAAPEISAAPAETEAPAQSAAPAEAPAKFAYQHDPRENPTAMEDIIENPDAVYGFSPNPDSPRLGAYADYDWSDAALVEGGRQDRIAYHEGIEGMYDMLHELRDQGKSIEEMARALSAERNRIRLETYRDDPEGLETVKQSNLSKYGSEEGPSADSLYEKYGSWELVLQNAFGTNPGMDACTGLYDDYYTLYVELGMIPNP